MNAYQVARILQTMPNKVRPIPALEYVKRRADKFVSYKDKNYAVVCGIGSEEITFLNITPVLPISYGTFQLISSQDFYNNFTDAFFYPAIDDNFWLRWVKVNELDPNFATALLLGKTEEERNKCVLRVYYLPKIFGVIFQITQGNLYFNYEYEPHLDVFSDITYWTDYPMPTIEYD